MKGEDQKKKLQTLYPLDSFGIQKVTLSGIRVERLEGRITPGVAFPHRHDFFQLLLVTAGKGQHRIDFKDHPVKPGQLFVMKPGQMHSWQLARGTRGIIVEFNHQSLSAFRNREALLHDLTLAPDVSQLTDKKAFNAVHQLACQMLEEFDRQEKFHDLSLQALLIAFLICILRPHQRPLGREKRASIYEKFQELLERDFRKHHSVEHYAQKLNTTAKALTMQLSRSIGRPPRALIQERLLLEAKRYLAFSQLTVTQIGYELGFEDANYFTRFFRVHEKMTPLQFRQQRAV